MNAKLEIQRLARLADRARLNGDLLTAQRLDEILQSYQGMEKLSSDELTALRLLQTVIAECRRNPNNQIRDIGVRLTFLELNVKESLMKKDFTKGGVKVSRVHVGTVIHTAGTQEEEHFIDARGTGEPQEVPGDLNLAMDAQGADKAPEAPQGDLPPAEGPEGGLPSEDGQTPKPDLANMSYKDLKALATELGLSFSGNIAQAALVQLLEDHYK